MRALLVRASVLLVVLVGFSVPLLWGNAFSSPLRDWPFRPLWAFVGFTGVLSVLVATVAESLAAPRTVLGRAGAGVAAAVVACCLSFLACLQLAYTSTIANGGTLGEAFENVMWIRGVLLQAHGRYIMMLWVLACLAGPLTYARVGSRRLGRQTALAGLGWLVLAGPIVGVIASDEVFVSFSTWSYGSPVATALARCWLQLALMAGSAPLLLAGLDRLVARLGLKDAHTDPAEPQPARNG